MCWRGEREGLIEAIRARHNRVKIESSPYGEGKASQRLLGEFRYDSYC